MILEGVVTNVTNFGAFVDIGVHQDGLVHISALSDKFVKDPREVVKAGDLVKVKVLEVDLPRKRIALTMRLEDPAEARPKSTESRDPRSSQRPDRNARKAKPEPAPAAPPSGAMAALFAEAQQQAKRQRGR
jgi:protein Tex